MQRPIQRLLVANRGEIACRIFRTAHKMGIATVAIYADGDRDAPFVEDADSAVSLEGASSTETYLDQDKILSAAEVAGADAIHPGYGFLSENAEFARAVEAAGLVWVGPSPEAIESMGDKLSAKRIMEQAGVPTLPAAELSKDGDALEAAREIGYPLLIKAAAGGGGKGMRVVESVDDLQTAVASARREAAASFGDDTIFLERWLNNARHVEVQLLGDQHGNLVHCFERECSIQRRHQKIIEEAPSVAVTEPIRTRLGEAAVAAGQAVGYSSAGTVEFLLEAHDDVRGDQQSSARFWFLEVNTRLQVEHPVTEEITGLDLVREQIRIAQGEKLGLCQDDLVIRGHAIEARVYAEDPEQDFLPVSGRVLVWEPSEGAAARFDSGVKSASVVGIQFDPMLAKVIVHADSRREAAMRLARVLEDTRIQGLVTNRDFLVGVLRSDQFLAGDTTTDFVQRVAVAPRRRPTSEQVAEAAILVALALQADRRAAATLTPGVPSGWRNSSMPPEEQVFRRGERELSVAYRSMRDGSFEVAVDGGSARRAVVHNREKASSNAIVIELGVKRLAATVAIDSTPLRPTRYFVQGPDGEVELEGVPRFPVKETETATGGLVAPMPGKVLSTHVDAGDEVEERQLLLILEAMKMEHRILAPHAGVVAELPVAAGEQVENGALLAVLEALDE